MNLLKPDIMSLSPSTLSIYSQCKPIGRIPQNNQEQNKKKSILMKSKIKKAAHPINEGYNVFSSSFISNSLNERTQICGKLAILKKIWKEQVDVEQLKETMQRYRPPLPLQFQKSILFYCSQKLSFEDKLVKGTLMYSVDMFRKLANKANTYQCLLQYNEDYPYLEDTAREQNENNYKIAKDHQLNVLKYNIMVCYSELGMKKQLWRLRNTIVNGSETFLSELDTLTANSYINFGVRQKYVHLITQNIKQTQKRHENICNIDRYYQQIKKSRTCNFEQAYNIGQIYYQNSKYQVAREIFTKIMDLCPDQSSKIYNFSALNHARCLFSMHEFQKAIEQLSKLSETAYFQSYSSELKAKLQYWDKTRVLLSTKPVMKQKYELSSSKQNTLTTQCTYRLSINQKQNPILSNRLFILTKKQSELNSLLNNASSLKKRSRNTTRSPSTCYRISAKKYKKYRYEILKSHSQKQNNPLNLTNSIDKRSQKKSSIHNVPVIRFNYESTNIMMKSDSKNVMRQFQKNIKERSNLIESKFKEEDESDSSGPSILSFDSCESFLSRMSPSLSKTEQTCHYLIRKPSNKEQKAEQQPIANLINKYILMIKSTSNKKERGEYYYKLGELHLKNKNYQMALNILKNASDCGYIDADQKLGEICYLKKNYKEAIDCYEKLLEKNKDKNKEICIRLLHCYLKIPQYHFKGIQKAKEILETQPSNIQVHVLLVTFYHKQKNIEKCIEICTDFKRKYPLSFDNYHLLGLLHKINKNPQEAYMCLLSALRLKPHSVRSLIQISQLSRSQNFYEELLSLFQRALSKTNDKNQILQVIKILIEKKQLKNIRVVESLSFPDLISHGNYFMDCGMFIEAEQCYAEAKKLSNNCLVKQKLGNVCYYQQRYDQALQFYQQSQNRKPQACIQLKIADIKVKKGDYEQAKKLLKNWMNQQLSSKGMSYYNLGICEYGSDNYIEALLYFKKSLNLGFEIEENHNWINKCYKKIDNENSIDEAQEEEMAIRIMKKIPKRSGLLLNKHQPVAKIYREQVIQEKQNY